MRKSCWSAADNVRAELGIDLHTEPETADAADVFTTLWMEHDVHPLQPLTTGQWA